MDTTFELLDQLIDAWVGDLPGVVALDDLLDAWLGDLPDASLDALCPARIRN